MSKSIIQRMDGRGQRGAERARGRRTLRVAALGLALVLGISGAAGATFAPPDKPAPMPGGMPTAPSWDDCAQRCFSSYVQNIGHCSALFCSQFLFFIWCDNDQMAQCEANAQEVFDMCLAGCHGLN